MKRWIGIFLFIPGALTFAAETPREAQFVEILNRFRTELGLSALTLRPELEASAANHANWMATTGIFSHFGPANASPSDRITAEGYAKFRSVGENIAVGSPDAVAIFRCFAFSPGHLANMVNPRFRDTGLAETSSEKGDYWVNDFGATTTDSRDDAVRLTNEEIATAVADVSGPLDGNEVRLPPGTSLLARPKSLHTPTRSPVP